MKACQIPVLLWRAPHLPVTPATELPQLLHLMMRLVQVVLDGELGRIEHADIAAEAMKNTRSLEGHQLRVRPALETISTVL